MNIYLVKNSVINAIIILGFIMAKFLITGGAGFIGSNFCYYMVDKYPGDEFVCLDALTYAGNLKTLEKLLNIKNFKFIHINICNTDDIDKLFFNEKFDYVINFAAETHVDRSIINPNIFLESNIIGVNNLLEASKKYKVKRFHQVSTDEVYGDLPLDRKDLLFKETNPLKTSSPYSASKASADLLTLAYHRTYNLDVTISRCSNNYGPYQFPEKLIPLMIDRALQNEYLPVYGSGENVRDWLHVYDHCVAIDLIVRNGRSGEIYNVGGNNEKSNIEIVKIILNELNKPESLIKHVSDRLGHDLRYAIDSTKLQKELGWKPKYTFNKGIKEVIKWNLENKEWLENVKSGEYLKWMEKYKNLKNI